MLLCRIVRTTKNDSCMLKSFIRFGYLPVMEFKCPPCSDILTSAIIHPVAESGHGILHTPHE